MTLGQKLKKLRADKGLTQKDLADQLHVTFQTVSKWENDENEPDISTLKELAKLYDASVDYLISEEEEEQETYLEPVSTTEEQAPVVKTIIVHNKELHVCERCGKGIPDGEVAIDHVCVRHAGRGHGAEYRDDYYHKECLYEVKRERAEAERKVRAAKARKTKLLSFGWGLAGGVVTLAVSLILLLIYGKETIHPGLAVLYSVLAGYSIFAMLYCIISGSYIGDVFVWCATLSIRFPGLIFSWDIEGFMWLIAMKILFAILGFLIGVAALIFAIVLSAALGGVSFPFVLIHNIRNEYADSF